MGVELPPFFRDIADKLAQLGHQDALPPTPPRPVGDSLSKTTRPQKRTPPPTQPLTIAPPEEAPPPVRTSRATRASEDVGAPLQLDPQVAADAEPPLGPLPAVTAEPLPPLRGTIDAQPPPEANVGVQPPTHAAPALAAPAPAAPAPVAVTMPAAPPHEFEDGKGPVGYRPGSAREILAGARAGKMNPANNMNAQSLRFGVRQGEINQTDIDAAVASYNKARGAIAP